MSQIAAFSRIGFALPEYFSPDSRLWFYVADRKLSADEIAFCRQKLAEFLPSWTAHNRSLKAFGGLVFDRILAIAVDETAADASGCGIDKSVHFVENLGRALGLDFFDRASVAFENEKGEAEFLPFSALAAKIKTGEISSQNALFDTTVLTKKAFDSSFQKPIAASWLARFC